MKFAYNNVIANSSYIDVQDNGIGISEKQQTHIFERFYRVKEVTNNRHNGKGLGLAITAHIISMHYGMIGVKSTLEKGSTFTIYLPGD